MESMRMNENKELMERQKRSHNKECCQGNFEKIATEIDIVIYIYKLLGFMDQMRLARVNVLLQDIFKTYIWRENYQTMKIVENSNGQLLVRNGKGSNWLYLMPKDFEEFLAIYAMDVQKLMTSQETLRRIRMPTIPTILQDTADDYSDGEENEDHAIEHHRQNSLGILHMMKNLSHLNLGKRYMEHKHLDIVVKYLPHLESFEIKLDAQKSIGYEDVNTYCKCLLQLKNLKRLVLAASATVVATTDYRLYRDLVTILELEYLKLELPIQNQKKFVNSAEDLKKSLSLKQLDIAIAADNHSSTTAILLSTFLNYENLKQLTLQLLDITLNDEALRILCLRCKNIEIFELKLTNIKCHEFVLPDTTREITITACKGLSCDNLQQILCGRNITKFISLKTAYSEQFVGLQVSNTLQYLKCDSVDTRHLMAGTKLMDNVKELTWYDSNNFTADVQNLMECHHLERLHIKCDPIPLKALLQLKNLHTLSFHHVYALNWSYVVGLLKQLSLQELIISEFWGAEVLDSPVLGFPTTIKILRINMNMIVQADFWLDLFCQNVELKLIFFGCIGPFHLKRIFNKPHFPRNLRTIEFSGISMNCDDLRRDFNETIRKTPFLKYFTNENHIILSR